MDLKRVFVSLVGAVTISAVSTSAAVAADDAADFYRNKTISMVIGYPPGGGFDSSARLFMRHFGRHIPGNPRIVPKNVPGAASLVATNYLFNVAPKDGTEFGMIGGSVPFGPLWSREGVNFDATTFNFLGSTDRWVGIALMWHSAPVTTLAMAKQQDVVVGATGSGDVTAIYPRVINALIGTRFKIVSGYQGTADLTLAIERGEVGGRLGWCWDCVKSEKPQWVAEKKVKVMLQLAFQADPELRDVPVLIDNVTSEADRQIVKLVFGSQEMARPFVAPPGLPPQRVETLRRAFAATMADPEFLAEAARLHIPVKDTKWQEMQTLIREAYATPPATVERAARMIKGD
jgi:tripartite-type tricarboxylate transporter receptor subunit TctC